MPVMAAAATAVNTSAAITSAAIASTRVKPDSASQRLRILRRAPPWIQLTECPPADQRYDLTVERVECSPPFGALARVGVAGSAGRGRGTTARPFALQPERVAVVVPGVG